MELAAPARRYDTAERRYRSHHPAGSEQHSGVRDRRLHASGERIEIASGFYLLRGFSGQRCKAVLEESRQKAEWRNGVVCRKEESNGRSGFPDCLIRGFAGSEASKDLCARSATSKHFL